MKLFLAGVIALALGTSASLFYEWTLYRAKMERMQRGRLPPVASEVPSTPPRIAAMTYRHDLRLDHATAVRDAGNARRDPGP